MARSASRSRGKDDTVANLGFEAELWAAANAVRHNDRHPDLKTDYVVANPVLDDSDWRGEICRTTSAGEEPPHEQP